MAIDDDVPVPRSASAEEVLRFSLRQLARGRRVIVATVLQRKGSAPSTPGQKLALTLDEAVGTIGGGAVEFRVLGAMQQQLEATASAPRVESFSLGATMGMCCGGSVDILLEPMSPATTVLIVGAGHIGGALAPALTGLGFRVVLCDGREEVVAPERIPTTERLMVLCADHNDPEVLRGVGIAPSQCAALVMTHDHQLDREVIGWALKQGFSLVGGVGSRAKMARTAKWLQTRGFTPEDVQRVRMPIGLDIGARLPPEIAVAIAAELVRWRADGRASKRRDEERSPRAREDETEASPLGAE